MRYSRLRRADTGTTPRPRPPRPLLAALAAAAALLATALAASPAVAADGAFGADADVTRGDATGKVIFVGTDPGAPLPAPAGVNAGTSAAAAGQAFLDEHAAAFGIAGDTLDV